MHPAAHLWARQHIPEQPRVVVEVGGADWNGGVRSCFAWSGYRSVDRCPGPGVDVVADFVEWARSQPPASVDLVVCLEVLEHAEQWPELLAAAWLLLEPGGRMVGTCAGPGRSPHGATGAPHPAPGEWYANVTPAALAAGLADAGFVHYTVDSARSGLDVRWHATR